MVFDIFSPATLIYFSNLPIDAAANDSFTHKKKDQNCFDKLLYINQVQLYSFYQLVA